MGTNAYNPFFANVLLHELAHATMKTDAGRYNKLYGKVIEESLATSLAHIRFDEDDERWAVNRLIQTQPQEYKAYAFWRDFPLRHLKNVSKSWSENQPSTNLVLMLIKSGALGVSEKTPSAIELLRALDIADEVFWQNLALMALSSLHR